MPLRTPGDADPKSQRETHVGAESAGAPASSPASIGSEPVPQAGSNPKLVAKLAEVFSAEHHLSASVFALREWFNKRKPGEDFGLRLLDCELWAANLCWLLVQAQIDAKGEEEAPRCSK